MRRIDFGERPRSREELAAWYSAALEAQSASGVSVANYAEQIGVTAATLYQWRRRLAASGDDDRARERSRLVEVTVAQGRETEGAGAFVVRVSDGRRCIEVPRGFDSDDLLRLVAALESC